ncbi:hypothetical protein [Enhygromyxa salina]|nr:hypothetical protein [Enhygromyxa salina]
MGCRPTTGTDSSPDEPLIDAASDSNAAPATTAEGPPRPEGAIFRSELLRATQGGSAAYLMAQIGPEAYRPQGRFEGWMITRVWPGDPDLCTPGCDLRPGDVILSVNGSKLETPEELSNLLAHIDQIESIELTGIRDGAFFERAHPILPDPPPND